MMSPLKRGNPNWRQGSKAKVDAVSQRRGLKTPALRINPETAESAHDEKAADQAGLILSSRCLGYSGANQHRGPSTSSPGCRESSIDPSLKEAAQA